MKPATITPFPITSRLCQHFPLLKLKIGKKYTVFTKPSFSFPFIKPPNMIPNVDEKILKTELKVTGNKPEAPWIKRCGFGIKFTDEIQDSEIIMT